MIYITETLNADHNRSGFQCGIDQLDTYIRKISKQDMKRFLSVVHVLTQDNTNTVIGYYTLSSLHIPRSILPDDVIKKLPKGYHDCPATLLGRLAVDKNHQGQKLGETLLIDALKCTYDLTKTQIGSMAVAVDPINKRAETFYEHYGFIRLPDRKRMFLPMKTISNLF